jgi:hypothetical protein
MFYILSGVMIIGYLASSLLRNQSSRYPILLLSCMWVLYWANQTSADYLNYSNLFDLVSITNEGYSTSQVGLVLLFRFLSLFKLNYAQALAILSFLGLSLIWSTIRLYSPKPQFVLILYYIYPFLLDVVQVKHFLAMSIILFSLRYLDMEKGFWKYLVGIVVASFFHIISLVYLPFVFFRRIKYKSLFYFILIYIIITIPLAYTSIFEMIATSIVSDKRIAGYFDNRARLGFFIQFFIQGIFLLTVHASRNFLMLKNRSSSFVDLVYRLNLYLIILFPLYVINMTFTRGFQILLLPNYIVYSIVLATMKPKGRFLLITVFLIIVVLMFIYNIYIPHKYTVLIPILSENMIVNNFH